MGVPVTLVDANGVAVTAVTTTGIPLQANVTNSFVSAQGSSVVLPLSDFVARISSPGPTFAIFGTSITDQNSRNISPPTASPSRAWFTDGYATWLRVLTGQRVDLPVTNDFGVSGDTLAQMLARIATVIASNPDYVIVEGGSNDITVTTFADMVTTWKTIVQTLRGNGITPIILPMPPRGGAVLTTAQVQKQQRFYNYQREFCLNNRGYLFADYIGYMVDQTSATSVPLANMIKADNLHPASTGAYWMGKTLADIIIPLLPPRPSQIVTNADIYNATDNPTGSLLYNTTNNRSLMAGTGGTETANANLTYTGGGTGGGLAAGWTFLRGTATSVCTVTNTKENPRADAGRSSGERQVIQIAASSGGGADEVYNLRFTPAIADVQSGDWYYAEASVEVSAGPVNCTALELYLLETRPSNSQTSIDMSFQSSLSLFMPTQTWVGVLRTPPIQRQSDATALQVNIRARLNATSAASITFKVGDFIVRKVNPDFV